MLERRRVGGAKNLMMSPSSMVERGAFVNGGQPDLQPALFRSFERPLPSGDSCRRAKWLQVVK
jgi:hypothetical protein